jgi:hypothetical protein
VAFSGFRMGRDGQGRRKLLRTYTFDYTNDGFARQQGFVVLSSRGIEAVWLAGDLS